MRIQVKLEEEFQKWNFPKFLNRNFKRVVTTWFWCNAGANPKIQNISRLQDSRTRVSEKQHEDREIEVYCSRIHVSMLDIKVGLEQVYIEPR